MCEFDDCLMRAQLPQVEIIGLTQLAATRRKRSGQSFEASGFEAHYHQGVEEERLK